MLSYVTGNLFEAPVQTLVNTVNTQGVMGKGIALTFKKLYPEMFSQYQVLCESKQLHIGSLFLYKASTRLVLNFPTKKEWRKPARLEYIEAGLLKFVEIFNNAGIHSIAFPPLGCGNGELDFAEVRPLMEQYLSDLPIRIFIYAPQANALVAEHRTAREMKRWLQSAPQDMPFIEFWTDIHSLLSFPKEYSTPQGTKFSSRLDEANDRIEIRANSETLLFEREELEELWRDLRGQLVLKATSAIGGRERDISFLLPILTNLPYIDRLTIAADFERFEDVAEAGIQLVPMEKRSPSLQQLELV